MDELVLFCDSASPPARACLMLVEILNIEIQVRHIDIFNGEQMQEDFLKINPAHTVPVLVHNGLILTDSHAILIYLCELFVRHDFCKHLLPTTNPDKIKVINSLFFESSVLFRRDSDLMSEIVRRGFSNIDLAYHERKVREAYGIIETYLGIHKYIVTDYMTIADISILTTISTVNLIFPIDDVTKQQLPKLNEWYRNMQKLPQYSINADGLARLMQKLKIHNNNAR